MRILFVAPACNQTMGGGERFVFSLAKEIATAGNELHIISSSAHAEEDFWLGTNASIPATFNQPNITHIQLPIASFPGGRSALMGWRKGMGVLAALPGAPKKILAQMAKFFPQIEGFENALNQLPAIPDIIHAFNLSWEYPALCGHQYAKEGNIPFVITPYAHLNAGSQNAAARLITMPHQRRLIQQANGALTLTKATAAGLKQMGITAKYNKVLHSGVDPVPPLLDPQPLFAKYNIAPPYAIFIGRTSSDKGAIDAAKAILALDFDFRLVLIGAPTPEFEKFFTALPHLSQSKINYLGRISDAEKHTLLSQAELFILPSQVDALGIVLLEAWQHAVPVIAAAAGGMVEVVDDGIDGILTPYGDVVALANVIEHLHNRPQLRQEMGLAGCQKVERQYQWEMSAQKALQAYQDVLSM